MNVPKERDLESQGGLLEMDRYLLGPVTCGADIVPDDRAGALAEADHADVAPLDG